MTEGRGPVTPEFSRLYAPEDLEEGVSQVQLVANDAERAALAKRFGLLELGHLVANVTLTRGPNPAQPIRMAAQIRGNVVQECVVSLAPIASVIDEQFNCAFAPSDAPQPDELEIDIDPDGEDPPELIINGRFDAGELIAEHFGLHLDPFPRAEGAEFDPSTISSDEQKAADNPFSMLKKLHERKLRR